MNELDQVKYKILIIRFSSFGDITQSLSLPAKLSQLGKNCEIHWITKKEFSPLIALHQKVTKVWDYDKKSGLFGLLQICRHLRQESFTHIYDAHNNLRSHLISWYLRAFRSVHFVRKSQKRWKRFLLFNFRKNLYEQPFSGQRDLIEPLSKWGLNKSLPPAPQLFLDKNILEKIRNQLLKNNFSNFIAIAPSAAFVLKRWPLDYWKKLIQLCNYKFVILGGPEDQFLSELSLPERTLNLAGKTDYLETAAIVSLSQALVANDTGVMHIGEQLGHPTIALMGPAPFGFPSRNSTVILQRSLPCRPCSKHGQGPCKNKVFHQCLRDISPEEVLKNLTQLVSNHG